MQQPEISIHPLIGRLQCSESQVGISNGMDGGSGVAANSGSSDHAFR